tara:strand:- start:55077 stop:55823 length:747 start_codon:yes stop_codon:yes gene_type:complete
MEVLDIIDIISVFLLVYLLYRLVKGTIAINIFLSLTFIYLFWQIVAFFELKLLSEILGQFIGFGVIILAIIFQSELRKFLIILGKGKFLTQKFLFKSKYISSLDIKSVVDACDSMSKNKTGAILIITQIDDLNMFSETGVNINGEISTQIIESIFYKNSPLHDGATIIKNNLIISAGCILPISNKTLPKKFGVRHRAAIGITEEYDAIAIVISEETGMISYVKQGELFNNRTIIQLEQFLNRIYKTTQ